MKLATQLSALPTNKLMTGSVVGPIATAAWAEVMATAAPSLAGPGRSAFSLHWRSAISSWIG